MESNRQRVGIVGVPPLEVIDRLRREKALIFDLDEPIVQTSIEAASPFLPAVYCAILRTVVINAVSLDLDAIYIDVGPGKCDCALHTATILEDSLPATAVIRTRNQDRVDFGTPVSRTRMGLVDKLAAITASVTDPNPHEPYPPCPPTAGFWGVPPRDFSLLSLFPDTTHVYGWSRCMENKTPDNLALEEHCNHRVPTVFFAQSFCAKTALARHLAQRHPQALYVDCDVTVSSSVKAKIQAFLELSGVFDAAR
ncbi:hypothetical protein [Desulfofustis limnaeus]|jgi:hypothetical protein|uniref:Uncharacterized protein n=1 Tax=Desulfofustis limnaeus TaxID=2740163 RepID=A0ABM7W5J1_9BACT|nr:hypothetical protein [Desulfofustis limnaeus]MDX9895699.1 hypothetical protein [Desulfofustis sp.]BDD86177.1 hypothetical protein DPPLL_05420 [Desulfofustis limnaeus]